MASGSALADQSGTATICSLNALGRRVVSRRRTDHASELSPHDIALDLLPMRVVIVGGGIGGLAAGVALRRVGVETLIVEQVAAIHEVGAGLSIWPNAMNAIRELGVEAKVMALASVIERSLSQSLEGHPIVVTDFSAISRNAGAPSICVHRAVLQRVLLEELPPGSVVTLEDGKRIESDVVVGADGINSVIRAGLHGTTLARYSGYTCWRGILIACVISCVR